MGNSFKLNIKSIFEMFYFKCYTAEHLDLNNIDYLP